MKKNPAIFISLGVLILVLGGGFLVIKNINKSAPQQEIEEGISEDLPFADPSIVVDLKAKADGKEVVLSVSKIPADTESIEYELSYLTGEGLPKGALGKITLDGKTEIEREILLGTCSKNVCTYDKGVTKVSLVLKFNGTSGATQFRKEYDLE